MRCHEVRTLDTPYLDSELDSRTSLEIDRHLAECADCARYFEAQRALDLRVDEVMRGDMNRDQPLWNRIEASVGKITAPRSVKRWWHRVGTLAVAAVVVFAFAWLSRPEPPANPLVAAVAADHLKYLDGKMPPQFEEEPAPEVLANTAGRLDRSAFFQLPDRTRFTPEGKRLCGINGVPIAWMVGNSSGTQVSVVVMMESEIAAFPALKQRFAEGHRIACFKVDNFEFGARLVDGHVVCAIGELPRREIESLLASVEAR